MKRIIEIRNCFECPHLDNRWSRPPWGCSMESCIEVTTKELRRVHPDCPLQTVRQYLDERRPKEVRRVKAY